MPPEGGATRQPIRSPVFSKAEKSARALKRRRLNHGGRRPLLEMREPRRVKVDRFDVIGQSDEGAAHAERPCPDASQSPGVGFAGGVGERRENESESSRQRAEMR